jgi:GPH family glycoside/pentoside/hexuronide:cation symporter
MNGCIVLGMVTSALLYVPAPDSLVAIFALAIIVEFSTGPVVALFFAMLGDAADYSEWRTNRRATGLSYSAGTLSIKVGAAIAASTTGWLLGWFGYVANVDQGEAALFGIRMLFSVIPAVVALLLLIAFQYYPLNGDKLREIEAELDARRSASRLVQDQ